MREEGRVKREEGRVTREKGRGKMAELKRKREEAKERPGKRDAIQFNNSLYQQWSPLIVFPDRRQYHMYLRMQI